MPLLSTIPKQGMGALARRAPPHDLGRPEETADVHVCLAKDRANCGTGAGIEVARDIST